MGGGGLKREGEGKKQDRERGGGSIKRGGGRH